MRLYTAQFNAVVATAAQDLFEIAAPADAALKIHDWTVFQTSDVGDAAEEILRLETVRGVGSVTSGSGGSTPTAQPIEDGDSAFGGTVEANNTSRMAAGSGTLETLEQYGWNVRLPMEKITLRRQQREDRHHGPARLRAQTPALRSSTAPPYSSRSLHSASGFAPSTIATSGGTRFLPVSHRQ